VTKARVLFAVRRRPLPKDVVTCGHFVMLAAVARGARIIYVPMLTVSAHHSADGQFPKRVALCDPRDENDMTLREQIGAALKQAMKDKAGSRLATLRLINAAIKDQDIAARGGDNHEGVSDAEILAILGKMTKQRQESVRAYEEGGRLDLAEREREEIAVISEFLPKQLSDEEVEAAIREIIEETGADSIRDMGKIMGALKSRYAGQMDFGAVGPKVKARLS